MKKKVVGPHKVTYVLTYLLIYLLTYLLTDDFALINCLSNLRKSTSVSMNCDIVLKIIKQTIIFIPLKGNAKVFLKLNNY